MFRVEHFVRTSDHTKNASPPTCLFQTKAKGNVKGSGRPLYTIC